mgnify:CR=1 FL=1
MLPLGSSRTKAGYAKSREPSDFSDRQRVHVGDRQIGNLSECRTMSDHNKKVPARRDSAKPRDELQHKELLGIRVARNRLFVCFWTLPVYIYTVNQLLSAGNSSSVIMYSYMLLYAFFGISVSVKRCPDCHEQFFVKRFFLNPFRSQCAHCGLSLKHL